MDTLPVKLPTYEHPLIPSPRFVTSRCEGCSLYGIICGGYYYADLRKYDWFHKECAEAPLKIINHPSHPHHPLIRSHDQPHRRCDLCGENRWPGEVNYSCSICNFRVDFACALRQSPRVVHPTFHNHPLVIVEERGEEYIPCEVCEDFIDGFSYSCLECNLHFHERCVHFSEEVNHPCHPDHPLESIEFDLLTNEAEKTCILCGKQPQRMCSICNFATCLDCTKNPPPPVIDNTKTHKHPLIFFPKKISCACNVCGKQDGLWPYLCVQCGFMVHGGCIDLPRVININRHDDRISFTHHLGIGYSKCGVCRESLSPYYGAYTCSRCPDYAVHTHCATRSDVWDGIELEGIPEDAEDVAPFKVVGDNLILHFLHSDHALKLHEENIIHDEDARCDICILPIGFDRIYSCGECSYILHEKCANLPKKKRLVFDTVPYLLRKPQHTNDVFVCHHCGIYSIGYKYWSSRGVTTDVHCSLLSEPFITDGHSHPLYFGEKVGHHCNECHSRSYGFMLSCEVCDFHLGLCCASLPKKIKHQNDEHHLTLCCGEKANGKYWCDICEEELDPSKWFYTSSDCGVTLHVTCVVGDFTRFKPGCIITFRGNKFEVVSNNRNTRPLCSWCHSRCKVDVILKSCEDNGYVCSRKCFLGSLNETD